jgi:hypothetical protein
MTCEHRECSNCGDCYDCDDVDQCAWSGLCVVCCAEGDPEHAQHKTVSRDG